jgi:hypothetical protein
VYPLTTIRGVSTSLSGSDSSSHITITGEKDADVPEAKAGVIVVKSEEGQGRWSEMIGLAIRKAGEALHGPSPPDHLAPVSSPLSGPSNSISFCTWNSLGPKYSLSRLLSTLANFTLQGFGVDEVLLDDGWGDYEPTLKQLRSLGVGSEWLDLAQREGEGLGGAIKEIKAAGVRSVGVWVTING